MSGSWFWKKEHRYWTILGSLAIVSFVVAAYSYVVLQTSEVNPCNWTYSFYQLTRAFEGIDSKTSLDGDFAPCVYRETGYVVGFIYGGVAAALSLTVLLVSVVVKSFSTLFRSK